MNRNFLANVISQRFISLFDQTCSLFLDEPKTPALWTTLTFRVLNITMAVTAWADHHAIFFGVEYLIVHFSPP